jgi:hypothetical protein
MDTFSQPCHSSPACPLKQSFCFAEGNAPRYEKMRRKRAKRKRKKSKNA